MEDMENSGLSEKERILLRFVDKVNHDSPRISPEDMQPVYAAAGEMRRSSAVLGDHLKSGQR
jgi:hypothetical protein